MESWRARNLLVAALVLAPAALAGCARPEPAPEERYDCEGWSRYWCAQGCDDCCTECCYDRRPECSAPPSPPCPTIYGRHEPAFCVTPTPCPSCHCPDASPCECAAVVCTRDVADPSLGPLRATRLLAACACEAARLGLQGPRLLAATETGLVLGVEQLIPSPDPTPGATWTHASPRLLADADGAWYATLAQSGALRVVALARWGGGAPAWERAVFVTPLDAPMLPLVERIELARVDDALVLLLAGADAAWALRSTDGGARWSQPEAITPPVGSARIGAPASDERGRLLVPFAYVQAPALPSALSPAPSGVSLHYAALGSAGAPWVTLGGMGVPEGIAPGARPSLVVAEDVARFAWVDLGGALQRLESWDDGVTWGPASSWSAPAERAAGTPGIARSGASDTSAWWNEAGALAVARAEGGNAPERRLVAQRAAPMGEAALVLRDDGRALLAWVDDEGALWLAEEE